MCPRLMSAPILVAGSSGSPTGQLSSSARIASTTCSLTERWTMSRDPAEQFSPMFQKIATATFAASPAKSVTSGNTSCGLLPPSSSSTRLRLVSGAPGEEVAADLGGAGEREAVDVGVAAERLADRVAGPGDDVEDAVRDPGLGPQLGDPEQAERGRGRGLDDDRVAGRERRAQLPGGHLGRVVPRDDRGDDAHRLAGDGRDHALRAPGRPGRRACRSPRRATGCRRRSRACRGPPCR